MLEVRHDREIHEEEGGCFHAHWHFSFDRYRDPGLMGVGPLRGCSITIASRRGEAGPCIHTPMSKALPSFGGDVSTGRQPRQ